MVFSYFCKYSQQQRAHLFPIYHGFCFVVNSTAWASGLLFHGATLAVAGAFREEERCNTFSVARKPQGSTRRAEDTSLSRGSKKTDNSLAERFVFDPDCQEAAEMDTAHSSTTSIDSLQPSQEYRQLGDVFAEENWEFAGRGEHFKIDLAEEEDFIPPSEHVEELLDTAAEGGAASKAAHKLAHYIPFLRKKPHSSAPTEHKLLGQWRATAIAGDYTLIWFQFYSNLPGNDITSSCLYTAGLCTVVAGKYAPISLLLVVVALYLYRNVYSEVGTSSSSSIFFDFLKSSKGNALPMNGGSYTVLLNTTSKLVGSFAACLTLISYIATAVV